jgi:hypothetical protein
MYSKIISQPAKAHRGVSKNMLAFAVSTAGITFAPEKQQIIIVRKGKLKIA